LHRGEGNVEFFYVGGVFLVGAWGEVGEAIVVAASSFGIIDRCQVVEEGNDIDGEGEGEV
jgi:hypothetical protein